jgi:hypothetical protein
MFSTMTTSRKEEMRRIGTGSAVKGGSKTTKTAARKVATPWGTATVTDEVKVVQQAGERRFATVVQLLESTGGEQLVRFSYTNDGVARRGPVTLRGRDIERLQAALATRPQVAEALGWGGGRQHEDRAAGALGRAAPDNLETNRRTCSGRDGVGESRRVDQ